MSPTLKKYMRMLGIRYHPARKRNTEEYFNAIFLTDANCIALGDTWGLISIMVVCYWIPSLALFLFIYFLLKANHEIANLEEKEFPMRQDKTILCIQMNHLESLKLLIENDPELLHANYKNHSLLYWCKKYNNTKALTLITQMLKKYPKED